MTNAAISPSAPTTKITLTITLTPENSEAMKDYQLWTGESPETILNEGFAEHMEMTGEGILWDVARDPKKRAAAFKRNNLSATAIAAWNKSLDAEFTKLSKETAKINAKAGVKPRAAVSKARGVAVQ